MNSNAKEVKEKLFDDWPDKYDRWFETPIGALVKKFENELLLEFLQPRPDEHILDVGCGTGIFTSNILGFGSRVTGFDISYPMLKRAEVKTKGLPFQAVAGDLRYLPFADDSFDKTVSMTALEFMEEGKAAVKELFRVTKTGGAVVVTTLNSLSPWVDRRKKEAEKGHALFKQMIFRSPDDMRALAPVDGTVKTAIHFLKEDDPQRASEIERAGSKKGLDTGAFVAARWNKK